MAQFQQVKEFILDKLKNKLPAHLSYHNIDHTIDVLQAAECIADAEGVNTYDKTLLLTAAVLHDAGFLENRDGHEERSCVIARECLPGYDYTADEIDAICGIIMATRLPQSPHTHLEEIICDADLDYLGRDDFFELSCRLYTELHAVCVMKDEDHWNREQAEFMANHHYYTKTAIALRQSKKERYIAIINSKI